MANFQRLRRSVDGTQERITFKVVYTEFCETVTINTAWSLYEFSTYVTNNIFQNLNLGEIELVDDMYSSLVYSNQRTEECRGVYPSTSITVNDRYGSKLHDTAFYIRPVQHSTVNIEEVAASTVAITVQPEQQYLPDYRQCIICCSQERNLVFSPCHHLCTCRDCGSNQTIVSCPICRVPIQTRLVIYV